MPPERAVAEGVGRPLRACGHIMVTRPARSKGRIKTFPKRRPGRRTRLSRHV